MFVTVVAVMCLLTMPDICIEEIVTTSDKSPDLRFFDCMSMGQAPIAKWKEEHPTYHSERWVVSRYKCVPGHYEIKGAA